MFAAMIQFRSQAWLFLFTLLSINMIMVQCKENDWPTGVSGVFQSNWTGTWHGVIDVRPAGEIGHGWNMTLEIGPYPMQDNTCTIWKGTYTEHGEVKTVKDYQFCRGHGAEDLYTDEGGGVTLAARWINDILVTPFKYKGVIAISCMRMRGDVLEEEIVITDDKPAIEGVVVSLRPESIYLMRAQRVTADV